MFTLEALFTCFYHKVHLDERKNNLTAKQVKVSDTKYPYILEK